MKLNARALAWANAVVMAVFYAICALFFAIVPREATAFFGYVFHADLSGMERYMSWETFGAGLIFWPVMTYLFVGISTWLYNGIVGATTEPVEPINRPTGSPLTPTA